MGIISITTDFAGQTRVRPGNVRILTTDTRDRIILPGYLDNTSLDSPIKSTDVISVIYNYSTQDGTGTYAIFTPTFTGNVITLSSSQEGVLLPVSDGHIAVFNGTGGQIKDGGILGTAANKNASDATKSNVASVASSSTEKTVTFFANNGTIGYLPSQLRAATANLTPGSTVQSISDGSLALDDIIVANIATSANSSIVLSSTCGNGVATITLSAIPGAGTLNYLAARPN